MGLSVRGPSRRLSLIATVTVVAGGASLFGVRHVLVNRARLFYWEYRCARWDGPVSGRRPAWAAINVPACLLSYRKALADNGWNGAHELGFFDADPVVFLHERVSTHGTHRIVCLSLGSNGHEQFCSLYGTVFNPTTLMGTPAATLKCLAWVQGWQSNVRWDRLTAAVADPADPAHVVFRYDEVRTKVGSDEDPDVDGESPDQLALAKHTVDAWLRDDGTVDAQERPVDTAPFATTLPTTK